MRGPEASEISGDFSDGTPFIFCVKSCGYTLDYTPTDPSPLTLCFDCFINLPAWRNQVPKGDHFLQIGNEDYVFKCHECAAIIERIQLPHSCESCRDTLERIVDQQISRRLGWNALPDVARFRSERRNHAANDSVVER